MNTEAIDMVTISLSPSLSVSLSLFPLTLLTPFKCQIVAQVCRWKLSLVLICVHMHLCMHYYSMSMLLMQRIHSQISLPPPHPPPPPQALPGICICTSIENYQRLYSILYIQCSWWWGGMYYVHCICGVWLSGNRSRPIAMLRYQRSNLPVGVKLSPPNCARWKYLPPSV